MSALHHGQYTVTSLNDRIYDLCSLVAVIAASRYAETSMPDHQTDDFDDIERLLTVAGSAWDASEAHGAFCGMACLGGAAAITGWVAELLSDADRNDVLAEERARTLKELAARTILSLEAGDMGFMPLLPDDHEPLRERTMGLADWCHGFMHGLATAGGADEGPGADALDASIPAEILEDFGEITRAGVEGFADVGGPVIRLEGIDDVPAAPPPPDSGGSGNSLDPLLTAALEAPRIPEAPIEREEPPAAIPDPE